MKDVKIILGTVIMIVLGVLLGNIIYLCSVCISKVRRKFFPKDDDPFGDIMNFSEEYDIFDYVCRRKNVCKKCLKSNSQCSNCVLRNKDNNTYQMFQIHINSCLSRAQTIQHLKNFKHYVKLMKNDHDKCKGNIRKYLMFFGSVFLPSTVVTDVFDGMSSLVVGSLILIVFLLLLYIVKTCDAIEARESEFYKVIIKMTDKFIKKKKKAVKNNGQSNIESI